MDKVIHVRVPDEWYAGLKGLADESEGSINQQARLAIRERLEREGRIDEPQQTATPSRPGNGREA